MADKLKVVITDKQKAVKVPTGIRMLVRRCCHAVLHLESFDGSANIGITFADNKQMKDFNSRYNNIDTVTPHITLPEGRNGEYTTDEFGAKNLGTVIISMERAHEMSENRDSSLQHEVAQLTARGVLELLGYRDYDRQSSMVMREKEEEALYQLGLPAVNGLYYPELQ